MSEIVAVLKDSPEGQARLATQVSEKKVIEPGEKVNDFIPEKSKIDPPLSIYEKENGKPYTADYFKIIGWELLEGEYDIDKIRDKVHLIEEWIRDKIKNSNLEDSLESYKNIMERYFNELNIGKTEKNESKLERIYLYLQLLKKQKKIDDERRELIDSYK